jgi:replication factor C small subunit
MDGPLWTETHAPALEELPQPEVGRSMERALAEPMNLVVHGPKGAGNRPRSERRGKDRRRPGAHA